MIPTRIVVSTFECTILTGEVINYVRINQDFLDNEFGSYYTSFDLLQKGEKVFRKKVFNWMGAKLEVKLVPKLKATLTFGNDSEGYKWDSNKTVEVDINQFRDSIDRAILREARRVVLVKREEEERLKLEREVDAMAHQMFGGLYRG